MDGDPLDQLADDYPRWRVWALGGFNRAWRLKSSPPVVLRNKTVPGLRAQIEEYERVWHRTADYVQAMAAAEALGNS